MKKNLLCLLLALALIFGFAACSCGDATPEDVETTAPADVDTTAATEEPPVEPTKTFKESLEAIDGVVSVEEIEFYGETPYYSERYLVTFEQPLDWNDPSKGTFPQRVTVEVSEGAGINVMETYGYCLMDYIYPNINILGMDEYFIPEMANLVTSSGNYINVEHRFFGGSRPADMTNTDTKYWEYNTPENAANDYHKIYSSLAPLLCDRWVSVGTSRGGLMTNVYAKYFPNDMDVYIAYVAPCSDGFDGTNMYDFVYNEIGNTTYGEELAKKYRDNVTAVQVKLIKEKEALLSSFISALEQRGVTFHEGFDDYGSLYDLAVLEFAVQIWQAGQSYLSSLWELLEMPEGTSGERMQKLDNIFSLLIGVQNPSDWAYSSAAWPYYSDGAMYYGQYLYDFSYLRAAMTEAGVDVNKLSVKPEDEKDIPWKIVFSDEQRAAFAYDGGAFRSELLDDMKTTTAKHLMIFGGSDPWRSQGVPEEATNGNDNIARYINPNYTHDSKISNMLDETKAEILNLLKTWLAID